MNDCRSDVCPDRTCSRVTTGDAAPREGTTVGLLAPIHFSKKLNGLPIMKSPEMERRRLS